MRHSAWLTGVVLLLAAAGVQAAPITAEFEGTIDLYPGELGNGTASTSFSPDFVDPGESLAQFQVDTPYNLTNYGYVQSKADTGDGTVEFGKYIAGSGDHLVTAESTLTTQLQNTDTVPVDSSLAFQILAGELTLTDYAAGLTEAAISSLTSSFIFDIDVNGTSVFHTEASVSVNVGDTSASFSVVGNTLNGLDPSNPGTTSIVDDQIISTIRWDETNGFIDLGVVNSLDTLVVTYSLSTLVSGTSSCNSDPLCGSTIASFGDPGGFGKIMLFSLSVPAEENPFPPTAVPEPSTLALLGFGLILLAAIRQRRPFATR